MPCTAVFAPHSTEVATLQLYVSRHKLDHRTSTQTQSHSMPIIDIANKFGGQYAGIFGVVGLALGVLGLVYGFYTRNSPKKPSHRISYKTFGLDNFIGYASRIARRGKRPDRNYLSYIDIWNSGSEIVNKDVVREPLSVGVQGANKEIMAIDVARESHPGISNFAVSIVEGVGCITWDHFDPGMSARIAISSSSPISGDRITLFGSGFRLNIRRVHPANEISTLPEISVMAISVISSLFGFSAIAGKIMLWIAESIETYPAWSISAIPITIGLLFLLVASVAASVVIVMLAKNFVTPKSPIEKESGSPLENRESSTRIDIEYEIDRQMYLDRMRSERLSLDEGVTRKQAKEGEPSIKPAAEKPRVRRVSSRP